MEAIDVADTPNSSIKRGELRTENARANHDPSRYSYYMTDEFYTELTSDFSDWQTDDRVVDDIAERDQFRSRFSKKKRGFLISCYSKNGWVSLYPIAPTGFLSQETKATRIRRSQ